MDESLRDILGRFELEHAGPVTAQEAGRWGGEFVERLSSLGVLRETTPAARLRNEACEHGCDMEPEIVTHEKTGERFGIHGCMREECGLVRIPLDDLRRWEFELLGLAATVARAIDAGGQIVEDVPGRLVEVGRLVAGDAWRDVFIARGLAWRDTSSELADARRLKASGAPLVLALGQLPAGPVWADCKPSLALLADIVSLEDSGLKVDLTGVIERPTKHYRDVLGSEWLTVTQAAERFIAENVIDDLGLSRAKPLISTAATRGQLASNGEKGRARRIESGSLAAWMLKQRQKNLAEDIDAPSPIRRRTKNFGPSQPSR